MSTRARAPLIALLTAWGATTAFSAEAEPSSGSGIRPNLIAAAEYWQNAHGGLKTGSRWNTFVELRAEVQAYAVRLPWPGHFFVQVRWVDAQRNDDPLPHRTGTFEPSSNLMANDQVRIYNLCYHQIESTGWEWKAGQIAVDDDFMASDYGSLFLNAGFGTMASQVGTPLRSDSGSTAYPNYSVAAPGVWTRLALSETFAWQNGLYYGGPGPDSSHNHGFSYAGARAGVAFFSETTLRHPLGRLPATARAGFVGHTGRFDNFAARESGESDPTVRGQCSVYATEDVTLAHDAAGKPQLGAFIRIGVSPWPDRSVVVGSGDFGIVWSPNPSRRPDEALGAGVSCVQFGRHYRALFDTARHETAYELTYRRRLAACCTVQGDVQILSSPARNPETGRRETAMVAGVRTTFAF